MLGYVCMHVNLLIENFCETNIKTERLIIFLTRKHGYGYWVWVQVQHSDTTISEKLGYKYGRDTYIK